ncbi:MAG: antirestriction protein ArdA, partial [Lachnospiraceae bacterium]|nr:antirestriction protein ArdA [Lachnospiraceae bacterium]
MRIYVKRENWDGGLWLALPASEADARRLQAQLAHLHPSAMMPFVGDVDSGIRGLEKSLAGELVFENGHLELFNRLAGCTDGMGAEDMLLFSAAVEMEGSASIGQVLETMEHLDRYVLRPEIRDLEGLGRYAVRQEGKEIPEEIEGIFDYGLYASIHWQQHGCFTEGGFVERISPGKEPAEKETGGRAGRERKMEAVFTVEIKKQPYGYESISLPMPEGELAEAERKVEAACVGHDAGMRVFTAYDGLFEALPPGNTIRELNQAAVEVGALMERAEPDWKLLLAALEAELPETMEDACRIIRSCADYEFLPSDTLEPEAYARYLLKTEGIQIPAGLQPYLKYGEFGQKKLEEMHPVKTLYGVVANRHRPIQTAPEQPQTFRLFSPLTITSY